MAITNPFSITYGSRLVGGASNTYLLHGPYVLDKGFESLRLVFDIVVVATSYATLKTLSDSLETDFRKRDQNLVINLGGTSWTYTSGTTILNTRASLSKTGDPETDRGFSRAYTCVVEGELPAADASPVSGLRDIEWNVAPEAGRQNVVTVRGVYTATETPAQLASVNYLHANGADAEATTFLTALDGAATFELVAEEYTPDRNDHVCTFTRQYVQLLANQSAGSLDDTDIRDHRVVFTDLSQHPGDSEENTYRLRRVIGNYDCAIDIDQTTNLQTVFNNKVKNHVRDLFRTNFSPQVFCIEDRRVSYDETTKRLSVSIQFLYQKEGGDGTVEVSQSSGYRESRNIDYTPVHGEDELAAHADVGWVVLEWVVTRTAIVLGNKAPQRRIADVSSVSESGWNLVSSTSPVTRQFIGDPDDEQIEVSVINETLVYRFNRKPAQGSTVVPITKPRPPNPITPGRRTSGPINQLPGRAG